MECSFVSKIEKLLGNSLYSDFLDEIYKQENVLHVESQGMDLVTAICEIGLNEATHDDAILACSESLVYVAKHGKPKEVLICLLEQAEAFVHSDKFCSLLKPMKTVMINLPKKRAQTFAWVLKVLNTYMKSYQKIPDDVKNQFYEGDDTILMEENIKVQKIIQTYSEFWAFYEPFVLEHDVSRKLVYSSKNQEDIQSFLRQETVLRNHLLELLGAPLIYFDLHWSELDLLDEVGRKRRRIKTDGRHYAEKYMELLSKVDLCPGSLFQWIEEKSCPMPVKRKTDDEDEDFYHEEHDDEIKVQMHSVANYFYLIFCEKLNIDSMSSVYSPIYMFNTGIHLINSFLVDDNFLAVQKGIYLAITLLKQIDFSVSSYRLEASVLDSTAHQMFIDKLANVVVFCDSKSIRHNGLIALKLYLWTFDAHGRYKFLVRGFNTVSHSGLYGYMISQLKDFVFEALNHKNPKSSMKRQFFGPNLRWMLTTVCNLKNGPTTDLAQNSDQIISALNLLRFLLIRDGSKNETGFLEAMPKVEEILLKPLRTALDMSIAHYQLRLKELEDPHLSKEIRNREKRLQQEMETESSVIIDGKEVSTADLPVEQQIPAIHSALSIFDLLDSLVARVNECISLSQRQRKELAASK